MKVSVLIPLYNQERYIEECLISVLNQTYKDLEVIVIDDGSTDGSYKIVEKYLSDDRIRLIKQNNIGLGATRNRLVNESTADFIYHLDSDDFIVSDCIESLVGVQKNNDSDIVFSNFTIINDDKAILKKIDRRHFDTKEEYIKYFFSGFGYKSVCNTLIRKDLYTKNNISVPDVNYGEDWSVIYKLVYFSNRINNANKYTYYYRKNTKGMTYTKMNDDQILKNIDDLLIGKNNFTEFINQNSLSNIYSDEINSYMIEVLNAIYSILIRNRMSIKWYISRVKYKHEEIKISIFNLKSLCFIKEKVSRKVVLFLKILVLLSNKYRRSNNGKTVES